MNWPSHNDIAVDLGCKATKQKPKRAQTKRLNTMDHHTYAHSQSKMLIDLCIFLHRALHWTINETIQFMRLCNLSHMRPTMAQVSLHIAQYCQGHNCSHTHKMIVDEGACLKLGIYTPHYDQWKNWVLFELCWLYSSRGYYLHLLEKVCLIF